MVSFGLSQRPSLKVFKIFVQKLPLLKSIPNYVTENDPKGFAIWMEVQGDRAMACTVHSLDPQSISSF